MLNPDKDDVMSMSLCGCCSLRTYEPNKPIFTNAKRSHSLCSRIMDNMAFDFSSIVHQQRIIIKRKNKFFQLVDLGQTILELNEIRMTEQEMFAKVDKGIAEYKAGKTKTLSSKEEAHNFLNSL